MGKHQADRRTLKAASVGTGIAAAVALSIAAVSGFGADESNRHTVPPSSIGSLASPWADIPVEPAEEPAKETTPTVIAEQAAESQTIEPGDAAMKLLPANTPPATVNAATSANAQPRTATTAPVAPTTKEESVTEQPTTEQVATEEEPTADDTVTTSKPECTYEAPDYCGYDVNVPELVDGDVGPAATVGDKNGFTNVNQGTIVNNYGNIAFNAGTVVNNYGTIAFNAGTVVNNYEIIVRNANGPEDPAGKSTITNNYGTVYHNGSLKAPATIENNYGEVVDTQGNIANDYSEEGN